MRQLLLVRPEPGLAASTARAEALGLRVIACPLFEIVPVAWEPPPADRFDALLLTSANALHFGGTGLIGFRPLPVHAVGEATAEAARAAGFDVVQTGDAGVEAMLETIPAGVRLFHPGGRHRHEHETDRAISTATVYESRVVEDPPLPPLDDMVVAIHSPRAGRRLAELVTDRNGIAIAAISAAAAAACGTGWRTVAVADRPDDERLLALAAKLCQTGAA